MTEDNNADYLNQQCGFNVKDPKDKRIKDLEEGVKKLGYKPIILRLNGMAVKYKRKDEALSNQYREDMKELKQKIRPKSKKSDPVVLTETAPAAAAASSSSSNDKGGAIQTSDENENNKIKIKSVGSKKQVWEGKSIKTSGGLKKDDLMKNKRGKIVSKKQHELGLGKIKNLNIIPKKQ